MRNVLNSVLVWWDEIREETAAPPAIIKPPALLT